MRHPEFPAVSFICLAFLLGSLPSHVKSGSVSTIALIVWLSVLSLIRGVNSLVWAGNVDLRLEVWCDITTKITIGFTFAIPAAALCILTRLEHIASIRNARTTEADKRKRQKFEAFMCFGVPILFMALHYIVQGHRFDLFEDIGCLPTVYASVASLCLVYIPPIVMSLISFVYAAISLRHILSHHIEFSSHLKTHAAISSGQYYRLMSLAVVEMIWDTGVNAYIIYFNTFQGLRPWISWGNVHSNFSQVQILPAMFIPPYIESQIIFQWWILPVSCVTVFIFFGFGEDAKSNYQAAFLWFRRCILKQKLNQAPAYGSTNVLPSYHQRNLMVNITLPREYNDKSGDECNAWEALSLKMPEGLESFETSSIKKVSKDSDSLSSHDRHSTAMDIDNDKRPNGYKVIPAVVVTKPSNVALRDEFSTTTRPVSRRSLPTDFGITVSPPYFPEGAAASRRREGASLTRDPQGTTPVPYPSQNRYHVTIGK